MKRDQTIPVYLITGFLDGGKSHFLQQTMQEDYFNDGSKSLLILCEEGEEEFTPEFLKKVRAEMTVIEDREELTADYLKLVTAKYKPERVLIEYNGMWPVTDFLQMDLPKNWVIYQIITILDGENFGLYLNNIKMTAMGLLTNTDMVIFNRCTEESDLVTYQRAVRSVNPRCELVFEDTSGNELECPEPDLPYRLEDDPINITDEDYTSFFLDLSEHPDRYEGKNVVLPLQIMQDRAFPAGMFIGGRRAMTCCEADIRFLPFVFLYGDAKKLKNRSWAKVTASMKWEFHEAYKEEGPVFHVSSLEVTGKPKDELVYF